MISVVPLPHQLLAPLRCHPPACQRSTSFLLHPQAPPSFNSWVQSEDMLLWHLRALQQQLEQVYVGMALAAATGRAFILPQVRCVGCEARGAGAGAAGQGRSCLAHSSCDMPPCSLTCYMLVGPGLVSWACAACANRLPLCSYLPPPCLPALQCFC